MATSPACPLYAVLGSPWVLPEECSDFKMSTAGLPAVEAEGTSERLPVENVAIQGSHLPSLMKRERNKNKTKRGRRK